MTWTRRGMVRALDGKKQLKRHTLEFGVKFDDGSNQQKQMINTHLWRVRSAFWFGETKILGREPIYANPGLQYQMNGKKRKKEGHDCS